MKVYIKKATEALRDYKGSTIGFDFETTGGSPDITSPCIANCYSPEKNEVFIIPLHVKGYKADAIESEAFAELMSTAKVYGHYLQYDLSILYRCFSVLPEVKGDSFLVSRILQWPKGSLKEIARNRYPSLNLDEYRDVIEEDISETPTISPEVYDLSKKELLRYCSYDAILPVRICQEEKANQDTWFSAVLELECEFLRALVKSRVEGIKFDESTYTEAMEAVDKAIKSKTAELIEVVGRPFKSNSTKDLKALLIDELGAPEPPLRTEKGALSMSKEALSYIEDFEYNGYPVVRKIIELKEAVSIQSGAKKLPEHVIEGRVHPEYRQIGYDGTSRVYTSKPSINQIPKAIRVSFIPEKGNKFIFMDWKAAELYMAGVMGKSDELLEAYNSGQDVHTVVASSFFSKPVEDITKEEREITKVIEFSSLFGSEGAAPARALHVSEEEGNEMMRRFFNTFSALSDLRDKIQSKCAKTGYTETYIGRRRNLPEALSPDSTERAKAMRQAFNTAIQGSVADCFKKAIIKACLFDKFKFRVGVFDSFLLECPESTTDEEIKELFDAMSDFGSFKFRYEWAQGSTWFECQEKA